VLIRSLASSSIDSDVVTGLSKVVDGKLQPAQFDDYGAKSAGDFQVA
jgi:hypothetical protein